MPYLKLFFITFLLKIMCLGMAIHADDRFTVADVPVDIYDISAVRAREKAIAEGQRKAFKLLLEELLSSQDITDLPQPTEAQLEDMTEDFEVQSEKNSAVRYLGILTFHFNPQKVEIFLKAAHKEVNKIQNSSLILILPIYQEGEKKLLWEEENAWRWAWNDYTEGETKLLMPQGDLRDRSALSIESILKGNMKPIQSFMNRYHAGLTLVTILQKDSPSHLTIYLYSPQGLIYMKEFIPLLEGETVGSTRELKAIQKTLSFFNEIQKDTNTSSFEPHFSDYRILFHHHREWIEIQDKLLHDRLIQKMEIVSLSRKEAMVRFSFLGAEKNIFNHLQEEGFDVMVDPDAPHRKMIKGFKRLLSIDRSPSQLNQPQEVNVK